MDFGLGFVTWIWDLDFGLGFGTGLGLDNFLLCNCSHDSDSLVIMFRDDI